MESFRDLWCVFFFFLHLSLEESESDYKSLNNQAKFIFRAMRNRSCTLRSAYNFLFIMRPWSIRL